ncbi:hypothetical protein OEA41_004432 [Lepraria neglecta]|uniref:Uncharacterized protein n=1 Tax=Lepraria neglecta TaxID=209136 RepID=A0AAD9YXW4_9LECA|nr:hypothetical protein OEA41_004432 [Lepraria neglecta]
MLTLEHIQQFLELLKAVQALPAPGNATKTEETPGDGQGAKTRASKLEFKTVNEIWDAKTYEYKITESSKPSEELTDLDQYVFVVHQRVEGLRDILRIVLREIHAINLNDNKPAIE